MSARIHRVPRRAFLATLAGVALARGQNDAGSPRRRAPEARHVPDELLRLAGSCVMSGWPSPQFPSALRELLEKGALGGLIIARYNFSRREDLPALCARVRAIRPDDPPPLLAADEEGGPVEHLSPPLTRFPAMPLLGAIDDTDLTHRVGAAIGAQLHRVGINLDFAPVLDVRTAPNNRVDLHRVFGNEPDRVARHGRAFIDGLTSAGVLACAKHFPGHGGVGMDSHLGLPRCELPLERLERVDLVPFRACVDATPAVMLAHVLYRAFDPNAPATLSPAVAKGLLRDRVGYRGVAVTDDVQMAALRSRYTPDAAAEAALRAGCDLVLVAHSHVYAYQAVYRIAGKCMDDSALLARVTEAAGRVRAMRAGLTTALPPNPFVVDGDEVTAEVYERAYGRRVRPRGTDVDPTLQR